MPSIYDKGALMAIEAMEAIADSNAKLAVGVKTKTTSSTTLVVTHGLGSTPDFILFTIKDSATAAFTTTANTTSVTVTRTTAQATWTVSYILGFTA